MKTKEFYIKNCRLDSLLKKQMYDMVCYDRSLEIVHLPFFEFVKYKRIITINLVLKD